MNGEPSWAQGHLLFKDEGPMSNVQCKKLPSIVGCLGDMSSAKKMGDATMKARNGTVFNFNKVGIIFDDNAGLEV